MSIENLKTIAIITLSAFLLWGHVSKDETTNSSINRENVEVTEDIRLYSNGQLIGEWQGIGRGRMVGETYVFKNQRGSFSDEIRISGDFIIKTNTD